MAEIGLANDGVGSHELDIANALKITWKQARNETFKVHEIEQLY